MVIKNIYSMETNFLKVSSCINFGNNIDKNNKPSDNKGVLVGVAGAGVAVTGLAIWACSKKAPTTNNVTSTLEHLKPQPSDVLYIQSLAQDMTRVLGEKISPENLKSVMGKNELLSILPKMKAENYSPKGNLENGVFKIDLHSHSNYSDGQGDVAQLLNQAAEYGNKLQSKTGENFIFALSDHDGIDGVKEALKLIAKNPEKYQNVRFVPAVEISFAHTVDNTSNKCEGSEVLAHCINPFSDKTIAFFDKLHQKRESMISNCLNELSSAIPETKFSPAEMQRYYLKKPTENFAYNLHWRILNYSQIKRRVSLMAIEQNKNPEKFYKDLMHDFHYGKNDKSPYNFNKFLLEKNMQTNAPMEDEQVKNICQKYFPALDESGRVKAAGENSFEDIIENFSEDKGICLGFAHPYFFATRFKNPEIAIKSHIEKSKGLLKTTESHHQSYPEFTKKQEIEKTNKIIEDFGLIPFGGQDNHSKNIINC